MIKVFGYSVVSILLIMSLIGCNGRTTDGAGELLLTNEIDSNLDKVNRIEIIYSDGNEIKIEDPKDIERIANFLRSIKLNPVKESNVGYLYRLKIIENDNKIELNNTVKIDNKYYSPIGDEITELNRFIINKGREKYPDLLSGIDI
ncbi:hypothetical protein PUW24_12265 [Paenibacillus urinalis]|uniref:Lipoprotein n=1 Tax=Paenibacillus urinalis TaxID=521520 RepID=A0AAX3N1W7_9BACL|nr:MULTISPECIES: hypothetical protein [Paenibacillus]WDH83577.1 hypothetical protein PUW23_04880 [Paenibacillus urinalis]WDH99598.1 hypothetical protein PUW24_12265 [Paenibacillus urinalis]WDI03232.1 hypothetical protein PUW25_04405 [Paenibacillus urinalis]GAK42327.1 hypothetical protein TCA2_4819 [Paenibacillus sp. TCA20]